MCICGLKWGRKEEHKHCILLSCIMDLVPGELGKSKDKATQQAPPPWLVSNLRNMSFQLCHGIRTLWMCFPWARETSPAQSCMEMALKPLWDIHIKETSHPSFHPSCVTGNSNVSWCCLDAGNVLFSIWCLGLWMLLQRPNQCWQSASVSLSLLGLTPLFCVPQCKLKGFWHIFKAKGQQASFYIASHLRRLLLNRGLKKKKKKKSTIISLILKTNFSLRVSVHGPTQHRNCICAGVELWRKTVATNDPTPISQYSLSGKG